MVNFFLILFFFFRLSLFRSLLHKVFSDQHSQSLPVGTILTAINIGQSQPFHRVEVDNALDNMQDANQVMVSDDMVFLI